MRRTSARFTLTAAATLGLAAVTSVQALGLGEIDVSSDLNQRFAASIPLTEINSEDLETVTVTIAPNEAFERAGIERGEYLSSLDFEIKSDRGRPRVVVSSGQIAREPVINLLVQARWKGGKILRDYTVLLDPPAGVARPESSTPSVPVSAAAALRPSPAPVIAARPPAAPVASGGEFYETAPEAKPAAVSKPVKPVVAAKSAQPPAVLDSAFDSATGSYGPVVAKETLWSIATKVRPSPRVSMDQVLLALAEANPVAIQRGTTVSKGAMLRVPSAERIQATSAAEAKQRLAALRGGAPVAAVRPVAPPKPVKPVLAAAPAPVVAPVIAAPVPAPAVQTPAPTPKPAAAVSTPAPTPAPAVASVSNATPPVPAESKRPELPKPQLALPPKADVATAVVPATATPASAPNAVIAAAAPAPAASADAPPSATTTPAADAAAVPPAAVTPADAAAAASATAATTEKPAASSAVPKSPLAKPLPPKQEDSLLSSLLLPLAALVLLAAGALYLLSKRRKKAAATAGGNPAGFPQFKPGDTSNVVPPFGGSGALGKLGDTRRLSDTQGLGPKAAAGLSADATQRLLTQQLDQMATQQLTAPVKVNHEATLILDADAMATLNSSVRHSAVSSGEQSFDKTTQVQVDTLHISLDDNDPLAEADFHLAYGLYDEAILLLMTATAQQPERIELKVKLAETYFAAGRPLEFQEVAEDLHEKLPPQEWSKIAIMGAQICPDVALFQSSDESSLGTDFDLAFDEPAELPAAPSASPAPAASSGLDFVLATPASADRPVLSLDDDFDDDDLKAAKGQGAALPHSSLDDDASIDFMLGQSLTPLGAGLKMPEANDLAFNLGSPAFNVEIPKSGVGSKPATADLSSDDLLDIPGLSHASTIAPQGDPMSFSLQDLEVSITPRSITGGTKEDEFNTKLDLARAYVEMGDNDMARGLLQEVQNEGNDRQQEEAAGLLQRLPA